MSFGSKGVWNDDGWAAVLGFKDFAGRFVAFNHYCDLMEYLVNNIFFLKKSAVVHMIGGISGIVTAWMIGPRIGRFKNGQPQVKTH